MGSPTVKTAVLAFALSSWVEGLTQLRTVLVAPGFRNREDELEEIPDPPPLPVNASLKDRVTAWFNRSGRPDVDMDDNERTALAVVDTSTAFIILQLLGQPILPFLLSPFLTTFPLPRSTNDSKSIKWSRLVLSTLFLAFAHEAQRVTVSLGVETIRKRREARTKALLGDIYVRGDELRPRDINDEEEEEDEIECLICAGVGADTALSQSVSSISSSVVTSSTLTDNLGPLEAFCAIAPQKHVAHRSCFLSWHAAYRQQRRHLPPEHIVLLTPNHTHNSLTTEYTRKRAQQILDAAGFTHLSRLVKFPHELPQAWPGVRPPNPENNNNRPLIRPVLTLSPPSQASSSSQTNNTPKCVATLHTNAPPCPGCRSSVLLRFFTRPVTQQKHHFKLNDIESLRTLLRLWMRHWNRLVTGKTVLYRLASQWSFVMALLSMLRVSHGTISMRYSYNP
ncbi:hypothetical protein M422DRAFT_246464 [Sphaerobolus stellatus SS14]|nr:hypothetical protein M422DRAFT_246464 [Sphaerobolus stellatus SS14]